MVEKLRTKIGNRRANHSGTGPKFNDETISKRNNKNGANPKCRLCNEYNETIDQIVSGCPVLAKSKFMQRHDQAALYMQWKICKAFSLPVVDKWYNHNPETVVSNGQVTLLWDMQVHTEKEIKANKPDIIIKDHINNTCQLIDMTVPSDRNVSIKEVKKYSKYKDLEIEISKMWKMKTITNSCCHRCAWSYKEWNEIKH